MISSNSCSASSIATSLKDSFSLIQVDSVSRRIRRLFNNKFFDPYFFYESTIKSILNTYKKKHQDKRVHIIFDHMYSHENYTVFMISMRIGSQGIPLYFECFKNINNSTAFLDATIIKGIDKVNDLFKDSGLELIFLADRWFNSESILKHIDDLGHTFCIRMKSNIIVRVYDKKEGHYLQKKLSDLSSRKYKATYYEDSFLYSNLDFKASIVISKSNNIEEPWIVATNGDTTRAIKDYGYRFGGIEFIFKNQKSNGFNLQKINNCNLKSFTSLYSIMCFSITWLVMIGADYCKNTKCYKNVKIEIFKIKNGKRTRMISLFKVGMILFKRAFNSSVYIRIPFSFVLYDI